MNSIEFKFDDQVSSNELFELMNEMSKSKNDRFPAKDVFHYSLRNENKEKISLNNTISVTAREKTSKKLIGFIRLLTDHAYMYYILDVMVAPDYRKKGIGKELMKLVTDKSKENGFIKIFLTAIPGSEEFYRQFGFKEGMSPVLTIRGEDYV
jgi:N-acetylglutamate synthase-like GNAT family acetyltransferase